MKTFRDIYKFPLVELGYSIGRVYDSDNNFVFQFHIESKSTREKLLKCINGEINLTNPHINSWQIIYLNYLGNLTKL